jgi:hypothetical protein
MPVPAHPFLPDKVPDYDVLDCSAIRVVDNASNKIEVAVFEERVFDDF